MKRAFFALVVLLAFTGWAYGAERTLDRWIKTMTSRIDASKGRQHKASATAGVKGEEAKKGEELYWKKGAPSDKELDEFSIALGLANEGKKTEAATAFERFKKDHPKSALLKDVEDGLKLLGSSAETSTPVK